MNKNKVIYLASYKAVLNQSVFYDVLYQDKFINRDIGGCMLEVDLSNYDFILASPPCNFWTHANSYNRMSKYSIDTKHLLPDILDKLIKLHLPFVVENVRNSVRFNEHGILNRNCFIYYIGRHTYFSNIFISQNDVLYLDSLQKADNIVNTSSSSRQGGYNVNLVFEFFLNEYFKKTIDICI